MKAFFWITAILFWIALIVYQIHIMGTVNGWATWGFWCIGAWAGYRCTVDMPRFEKDDSEVAEHEDD